MSNSCATPLLERRQGFTDEFVVDVGPALGLIGSQIIEASNAVVDYAVTGGALLGAGRTVAVSGKAAEEALLARETGRISSSDSESARRCNSRRSCSRERESERGWISWDKTRRLTKVRKS